MLWQAALYNNGGAPYKNARYGESYAPDGTPQRLQAFPPPTRGRNAHEGLAAVPRSAAALGSDAARQRAARVRARRRRRRRRSATRRSAEEPGRPDVKLSDRGFGTGLRTDPVFLGLQKTRLLDPLLSFPGTNDQPGDYRGSGCTALPRRLRQRSRSRCTPAQYAPVRQRRADRRPSIRRSIRSASSRGHPIKHTFTRSIPSSQCMTCHMHPGTNMVTTYYGYTWWENETDGEHMYPPEPLKPIRRRAAGDPRAQSRAVGAQGHVGRSRSSSGRSARPSSTASSQHTQFADFHGHGWVYRAVYKRDRQRQPARHGRQDRPARGSRAVRQGGAPEGHPPRKGDAVRRLPLRPGQPRQRQAVRRDAERRRDRLRRLPRQRSTSAPTLITSGPAAPEGGTALAALRTPSRERRFDWEGERLYQRSMMDPNLKWEVVQTVDTITPGAPHYNEQSRYAKTIQKDGDLGRRPADCQTTLAHAQQRSMTCYTCHTSWTPTCFGCHLSMVANRKMPMLHNEGLTTRNWTGLQLPGAARRLVLPRPGRHRHQEPHRAGPLGVRRAGQLAEPVARRGTVLHAADGVGRGLQRPGVQHVRAAHGAREGDQAVHRLPRRRRRATTTRGWPTCCCRAPTS